MLLSYTNELHKMALTQKIPNGDIVKLTATTSVIKLTVNNTTIFDGALFPKGNVDVTVGGYHLIIKDNNSTLLFLIYDKDDSNIFRVGASYTTNGNRFTGDIQVKETRH